MAGRSISRERAPARRGRHVTRGGNQPIVLVQPRLHGWPVPPVAEQGLLPWKGIFAFEGRQDRPQDFLRHTEAPRMGDHYLSLVSAPGGGPTGSASRKGGCDGRRTRIDDARRLNRQRCAGVKSARDPSVSVIFATILLKSCRDRTPPKDVTPNYFIIRSFHRDRDPGWGAAPRRNGRIDQQRRADAS
jgi:hypothetical protein